MADTTLEISGVTKRFGGLTALDNAAMSVERASITGVIGPNGSGKSTLFNCIAGTLRPDNGIISFDGVDITGHSPAEICDRGIARTFQISRMFREMTVLENLVVVAHGLSDNEAVDKSLDLLEFLEITQLRDKQGAELSYGQRKLVEIARALMLDPQMMLLDEPFAGINPRLQNRIVEHLQKLRDRGLTLFFIDHEMRIVLEVCDTVHVLAEGRVISAGKPGEVKNDPAVLDAYF